jgi:SAM-dependent methyltransferase
VPVVNSIKNWLSHPETRGMDLDDPRTTHLRRELIRSKPALRDIYEDWYRRILSRIPAGPGEALEIGSGAGFLKDLIPGLITSEFLTCGDTAVVLDAQRLPFAQSSLRAVVMTNVLHHIPDAARFFADAARCVRPGGAIVMIEPWVSTWSRFVYSRLHHEPFDTEGGWQLPPAGPLSGANGALPWILFSRDRARFDETFPEWTVARVEPLMPFRYLLSGGVSMRCLVPHVTFALWKAAERALTPVMSHVAMFAEITLVRRERPTTPARTL